LWHYYIDIIGNELKAVKKAFHGLKIKGKNYQCDECQNSGCVSCLPKITMVRFQCVNCAENYNFANLIYILPSFSKIIAQSQHNIVLAPSQDEGVINVPSGTCVEGLFPSLNLVDDRRMNGLFNELDRKMQLKNETMFQVHGDDGSTAFALIAHGYVPILNDWMPIYIV
jgi:hypothetical protein